MVGEPKKLTGWLKSAMSMRKLLSQPPLGMSKSCHMTATVIGGVISGRRMSVRRICRPFTARSRRRATTTPRTNDASVVISANMAERSRDLVNFDCPMASV